MLPSNTDAHHHVGDIRDEIDKALNFVKGMELDEFCENNLVVYAVQKAVQNAIESCIRLEDKRKDKHLFTRLCPEFDIEKLRLLANRGRHDYEVFEPGLLWDDLHGTLTDLRNAAEALLAKKRH